MSDAALRGAAAITAVLILPACLYEYRCVNGAVRVDGKCVFLEDAGPDASSTDAATDAGFTDADGVDAPIEGDGCIVHAFYRDEDGDDFGTADDTVMACTAPDNYVTDPGDCDDSAFDVHPDATELCDAADNDCDVAVDEGLLGLVGAPIDVGPGENAGEIVALDSYELGYVAVWLNDTGRLQYKLFSTAGGVAVDDTPVATPLDGDQQIQPVVRVASTSSGEYAVIAWIEGSEWIRARVIPLDGRSPLPVADLEHDATTFVNVLAPAIAVHGDTAIIGWINEPAGEVRAVRLDVASGAALGSPTTIYSYDAVTSLFGRPLLHVAAGEGGSTLLLGVQDQRAGDTAVTGYITGVDPDDLSTTVASVRVRPEPTEGVFQLVAGGRPDGVTLGVYSSGGGAGTIHYFGLTVLPGPPADIGLTELGTLDDSGAPLGVAGLPAGLLIGHVNIAGASTKDLWVSELLATGEGVTRVVLTRASDSNGIAVAAHPSGARAALYAIYEDASGTAVFLQRVGCE